MTGQTGQKCASSGKYHCKTHPVSVISIKQGDTFPMCNFGDMASHKTTWVKDETV